ncbi:hypothetical protein [Paraburkholderia unamae]|uniref:hypothetical protein n=1 Tax=Paraburkholderia unamae TaxID=219649 RepID=UPI001057CD04|nr:hypothetical protein [Paraburkholderia unamae]
MRQVDDEAVANALRLDSLKCLVNLAGFDAFDAGDDVASCDGVDERLHFRNTSGARRGNQTAHSMYATR